MRKRWFTPPRDASIAAAQPAQDTAHSFVLLIPATGRLRAIFRAKCLLTPTLSCPFTRNLISQKTLTANFELQFTLHFPRFRYHPVKNEKNKEKGSHRR
jgi:hypothetical protein